jgi:hypothetical protein
LPDPEARWAGQEAARDGHVIVEGQAAMGDATAVPATFERLMREGLSWQDACMLLAVS